MDVNVNFSGKQKGAWMDPDVDLEEVDTFTLDKITNRMLCRVAQGIFDQSWAPEAMNQFFCQR
jgi:hypothetical protein